MEFWRYNQQNLLLWEYRITSKLLAWATRCMIASFTNVGTSESRRFRRRNKDFVLDTLYSLKTSTKMWYFFFSKRSWFFKKNPLLFIYLLTQWWGEHNFIFWPHCAACRTYPTRGGTHVPSSGSTESQPLEHQESPKMWYFYTVEYYLAMKINEELIHTTT